MNVAERKQTNAPADAQRWLESFGAALQVQNAQAAADYFQADGLWRDVLAFTWTIQTMAGRQAIAATLQETLARAQPGQFHISPKRTPPRWVTRAGIETIEVLFDFETAFGPANGVVRLVPDPQAPSQLRAWTLNTNLHELRGHEEEFKRRAPPDSTRDFGAENWSDRLARTRAYADHDPTVIVVGGGQAGLVHRRATASARRRHFDCRPAQAHRRQLAHALPFTDAAQRSLRQPPALSAVSADLPRLYPEGQAGELV